MNEKKKKNLELWQKKLLDLGMRNRLINYKETQTSTITITAPEDMYLFKRLVTEERALTFPASDYGVSGKEDSRFTYSGVNKASEQSRLSAYIQPGDLKTDKTPAELKKVLKNLSSKQKTANEEQGVNILFCVFDFLIWTEAEQSKIQIKSPLLLVPVILSQESLTSPYTLTLHEDEIVVNPTLAYKLETEYGIQLPPFDPQNENSLESFLEEVKKTVKGFGWSIEHSVSLALLSFLKINMYQDLSVRAETIAKNSTVKALCGIIDSEPVDITEINDYDHDARERPCDIFQVMDADSSQQDAIELSKRGISFVLQGPPGTGKSQTITNIIAEAMAAGKKVLFVSEKVAALEVVYKRLAAAGLSDFCLVLHSHKANKKELLNSLGDVIKLKEHPLNVKSEAMLELRKLEEKRKNLNAYCSQLHQIMRPLDQSVYDANGIIAGLEDIPYVRFDLSSVPVSTLSKEELMSLRLSIQKYATSLEKLTESYSENTWRNSTITEMTYALSHDIKARFDALHGKIEAFCNGIDEYNNDLGSDFEISFKDIHLVTAFLDFCSAISSFPLFWLEKDSNVTELRQLAEKKKGMEVAIASQKATIDKYFTPEVYTLPIKEISSAMEDELSRIRLWLDTDYYELPTILVRSERILDLCGRISEAISQNAPILTAVAAGLGIPEPETLEEVPAFSDLLRDYMTDFGADKLWFQPAKWTEEYFQTVLQSAKDKVKMLTEVKEGLLKVFTPEILGAEYRGMLRRFKNDYGSAFRFFNGEYHSDAKLLKNLQIDKKSKLSFEEMQNYLIQLQKYHEAEVDLQEHEEEFYHVLGKHYCGLDTDFELISSVQGRFRDVLRRLGSAISRDIRNALLDGTNQSAFAEELISLELLAKDSSFAEFSAMLSKEPDKLSEYEEAALNITSSVNSMLRQVDKLENVGKQDSDILDMVEFIPKLTEYHDSIKENASLIPLCQDKLGDIYTPVDTNWDRIFEALHNVVVLKQKGDLLSVQESFLKQAASDPSHRALCKDYSQYLTEQQSLMADDISWLAGLFDEQKRIGELTLIEMQRFILRCRNNLQGLEAWVDFRKAKRECEQAGLSDFIDQSLTNNYAPDTIEKIFLKRFEHVWLDAIMPKLPAVSQFRSRTQNAEIIEFRKLDKEQLEIAKSRIRSALIQRLPDINGITSAKDEVAILRREMGKQRKIMPVRKLFSAIPNLLPRLKPCLMMSPLSVSMFLQDDSYTFDMVIFDEASQVQTENAIGAISRGKQVIIAGDIHQLPPTNFFSVSVSGDEEYDEENDTDSFESVLSEARSVLPEEELKWHYRSKNENLIAFSNHKIYHDSLVTFPAPSEENDSEGVEYIYVPDGIYDRSRKRTNSVEAQKVADVVFDQIRKFPERSIGIITFSEAQMRCVDDEITKRRLANPQWEDFFHPGKEEPFFVKNLENVQGDERDTIIFSIGYAKSDRLEQLSLNFGPLNKSGGYRRLNVAVTRAKYAVKLVGSILPTDMRMTDATPEGVRLLHDYIEFAQQGPDILKNELSYNDQVNTESPFEDAVYDFLSAQNYSVATQVGCSGYRIDMAVRHPRYYGKFVVGIECDGASYHSSRTARERDRIRQSVLESMGWKFIRIWSTDWIKDPVTEGKRVLAVIKEAIKTYDPEAPCGKTEIYQKKDTQTPTVSRTFAFEETVSSAEVKREDRFGDYREIQVPWNYTEPTNPEIARTMDTIVKTLSPVHMDDLCRQIAPLLGKERISDATKSKIEYIYYLYQGKNGWTKKGDFICDQKQTVITPMVYGNTRPIEYISMEELAEAMYILIDNSFGLEKDSLIDSTARTYGFQRTGPKIRTALEESYAHLKYQGRVKEINGKISTADRI